MKNVRVLYVDHVLGCLLGGMALLYLSGCGPSQPAQPQPTAPQTHDHDHDHDHDDAHDHDHDHSHVTPADFTASVAVLRGHFETIRDAFTEKDLDKAHDPIHEVGHVLEGLPELAAKAGLTEQDLAKAQAAVAAMFEAYGKIDQAIHEGEEADYEAVRDKLDQGMADLDAVVQGTKKED
ncbi:MAG: hypothetical protein KJ000_07365 [Pirellulaceae bacterium]|nr:hypothetical protein [Pirellulaceae bacterium]